MGYHRAGFDVVGVDIAHQKNYPFEFHRGDALEFAVKHGREFDAIHASPPCQAYTSMRSMPNTRKDRPDLVGPTRDLLVASGKPFVIENVPGSPLRSASLLCGTQFGLGVDEFELRRHRWFECSFLLLTTPCRHSRRTLAVYGNHGGRRRVTANIYGHSGGSSKRDYRTPRVSAAQGKAAMGIDWMTWAELAQAIPPAYTEFVGRQLLERWKGAGDGRG